MLQYKEPDYSVRDIQGEYSLPPLVRWPSGYPMPDFELWRRRYKKSAVRNLSALLLFFHGIPVSDIAVFAGISPSRVRSLNETTKKRLFGDKYESSKDKINSLLRLIELSPKHRDHFSRELEEIQGNKPEIQATLYALGSLIYDAKDIAIFYFAGQFATQYGNPINFSSYEWKVE